MENVVSFLKNNKFFLLIASIYLLNCLYYYPFIADDALISVRYSQRFIEGKGLTWNDGEFVEGYSNFLWVIAVSVLGFCKLDLILCTRILGIFSGLTTIFLIHRYFRNYRNDSIIPGLLFLILSGSFAVWSVGGLEQPFVILFLTAIIIKTFNIIDSPVENKNWNYLGIFGGLLSITRPDGILFITLTCIFLAAYFTKKEGKIWNKNSAAILKCFLISLGFYITLLIFRIFYYGELVPNTALVKANFSVEHLISGLKYIASFTLYTFPVNVLCLIGLLKLIFEKKDPKALYLSILALTWTGYIVSVGGDFMPAFRLLEITVLIMTIAVIYCIENLNFYKNNYYKPVIFSSLGIFLIIQLNSRNNNHAKYENWEFTGIEIGENFRNTFHKDATIAVTAAGSIPYGFKMRAIDMLGLNDYYLARNPPKDFGKGKIGHELGDSDYLLRRKPDIIIFNMGDPNPDYPFSKQLLQSKTFNENYVRSRFVLKNDKKPRTAFLYKYGGFGIKFEKNQIVIPHYLFTQKDFMTVKNGKFTSNFTTPVEIIFKDNSSQNWQLKEGQGFTAQIHKIENKIHLKIFPTGKAEVENVILIPTFKDSK